MKIIIILILFLILVIIYKLNKTEYYSAKINNLKIETCANTCARLYGCSAFAYNEQNNSCYLSNLPINNNPLPAVYSAEFKPEHIICNKVYPIQSERDMSTDLFRDNLSYHCITKFNDELGLKYFDVSGIINLTSVDQQSIKTEPYDLYNLDICGNYNWENLPRIPLTYLYDYKVKLNIPDIKLNKTNIYDLSFNNISNINQPLYLESCRNNIDLDTCKNMCKNNSKCKSIEFIKNINNINNICCLKSNINKSNDNSEFYLKETNFVTY